MGSHKLKMTLRTVKFEIDTVKFNKLDLVNEKTQLNMKVKCVR